MKKFDFLVHCNWIFVQFRIYIYIYYLETHLCTIHQFSNYSSGIFYYFKYLISFFKGKVLYYFFLHIFKKYFIDHSHIYNFIVCVLWDFITKCLQVVVLWNSLHLNLKTWDFLFPTNIKYKWMKNTLIKKEKQLFMGS